MIETQLSERLNAKTQDPRRECHLRINCTDLSPQTHSELGHKVRAPVKVVYFS